MSLINQMLKDLDARRNAEADRRPVLPSSLRVADHIPRRSWVRLVYLSGLMGIMAVAGWFQAHRGGGGKSAAPPAPQAAISHETQPVAPLVVPAPAKPSEPPAPPPETVKAMEVPVAAVPRDEAPAPAFTLTPPPAPVPEKRPAPHPSAPSLKQGPAGRVPPRQAPLAKPVDESPGRGIDKAPAWKTPVTTLGLGGETSEQLYLQGVRFYAAGQFERARTALEQSLELDRSRVRARIMLAKSLAALGDIHRAADLLAAVPIDPADTETNKLRVHVLLKKGDVRQAEDVLARSVAVKGGDTELLGLQAALYQRQGKPAKAAALYQELVREDPKQSKWWLGLAISLEAQERFEEALDGYRHALAAGAPSRQVQDYVEARIQSLRADQ